VPPNLKFFVEPTITIYYLMPQVSRTYLNFPANFLVVSRSAPTVKLQIPAKRPPVNERFAVNILTWLALSVISGGGGGGGGGA
jgi:hypothetical protein